MRPGDVRAKPGRYTQNAIAFTAPLLIRPASATGESGVRLAPDGETNSADRWRAVICTSLAVQGAACGSATAKQPRARHTDGTRATLCGALKNHAKWGLPDLKPRPKITDAGRAGC